MAIDNSCYNIYNNNYISFKGTFSFQTKLILAYLEKDDFQPIIFAYGIFL